MKASTKNESTGYEWEDNVEKFEAADESKHKLYYKGEGENAELYLQSEPMNFLKQLENARSVTPRNDVENKKAINEAEKYYIKNIEPLEKELKKLQKALSKSNETAQTQQIESQLKDRDKKHQKAFVGLKELIKEINFYEKGQATTVQTQVTSGGLDSEGRATWVKAYPLTWLSGNTKGTSPQADPAGWDYANSGIRKGIYVRGHLLNDNLHGPGLNWNLTPITSVMNSQMKTEAEEEGKSVLKEKNKLMYYQVEAKYFKGGEDNDKYFPKEIIVIYGDLKKSRGKFEEQSKTIETYTQGRPATPFNINDLGETNLQDKLGVSEQFAKIVNEERKENGDYLSFKDLSKRISKKINSKNEKIIEKGLNKLEKLEVKEDNGITFKKK